MNRHYRSWGLNPRVKQTGCVLDGSTKNDLACYQSGHKLLAYGCGSSYGDVCLNDDGILLDTCKLDHFLDFNPDTGVLRCESGVTLHSINQVFVKHGWFLPVTPGTQNVTLGGAIANDVHGKNHHQAGSFGCHVIKIGLYRSQEGCIECQQGENEELFRATIAGLGLTGFIQWAEIQLKKISSPFLQTEKMLFANLQEFDALSREADKAYEYTVAWIDSIASKKNRGRGVLFCGEHAGSKVSSTSSKKKTLSIPFNAPKGLLSYPVIKTFNMAYFNIHRMTSKKALTYYQPFFYPLDSIGHWNRLYGKKGLYQYQCVIPLQQGIDVVQELLTICAHYMQGSFLSVLKKFGDIKSPGILSFPRPGYTLALDFRNLGESTLNMFSELDRVVFANQGALYPAKDARMSSDGFRQSFPELDTFKNYIDPVFSSNFMKRVML